MVFSTAKISPQDTTDNYIKIISVENGGKEKAFADLNNAPARFVRPFNGFIQGANSGYFVSLGKATLDVVVTDNNQSASIVSIECISDHAVEVRNVGRVNNKTAEYLVFNGVNEVQFTNYGGSIDIRSLGVTDENGKNLSVSLDLDRGVVIVVGKKNAYGTVRLIHNYSATRFVVFYRADDFSYFIEFDRFNNAIIINNGQNLSSAFFKVKAKNPKVNYAYVYQMERKAENTEIVQGNPVSFDYDPALVTVDDEGNLIDDNGNIVGNINPFVIYDKNSNFDPFAPIDSYDPELDDPDSPSNDINNPDNFTKPAKPVYINPYSYANSQRSRACQSQKTKPPATDCLSDTSDANSNTASDGIGRKFYHKGLDGKIYSQDECGNYEEYSEKTGKPCEITFKEESREETEKKIKDPETDSELIVKLTKSVTFKNKKGSTLKLEFKDVQ